MEAVERYILGLMGSALRHSFRTPLSIIHNALKEINAELVEHSRGFPPKALERLKYASLQISELRATTLEFYRELGTRFKEENTSITADEARRILRRDVRTNIIRIHDLCMEATDALQHSRNREVATFTQMVRSEANRMMRILDGILRLAEAPEHMKIGNVDVATRMHAAALQVRRNFDLPAAGKRIAVPQGERTIEASQPLIDLLFQNLFENAVRYALRDRTFHVRATADFRPAQSLRAKYPDLSQGSRMEGSWLECHVLNAGSAIPPSDRQQIFRLYFTTEQSTSAATGGGSGVGLALCQLVCAIHGGFIFVDYANRQFTDFVVLLPARQQYAVPPSDLLPKLAR
jgi:signal transduction histidine kinase